MDKNNFNGSNIKGDIFISYSIEQKALYRKKDNRCRYDQFERPVGINKHGNFVEMVSKKYFEDLGYKVESFFYLVRNKIKRERMLGFIKICKIFGEKRVRKLIKEAELTFSSLGKRICGGDPDLFVYDDEIDEAFFVEVKDKDNNDALNPNQKILFPIIEKHLCPVYIAKVYAK